MSCYKVVDHTPCLYCQSPTVKFGKRAAIQRYRCKTCLKIQQHSYKKHAYAVHTDSEIAAHVKEGCGIRSIARLLHISATTVISRIQRIAESIPKPEIPKGRTYEVDELKTYVSKKEERLLGDLRP